MELSIDSFERKHDHLLCIDSDGTVIDAMNVKHERCHGLSFIEEWGLQEYADEIQAIWNEINLYAATRGINRFLALEKMLDRMEGIYLHTPSESRAALAAFIEKGDLSNKALQAAIDANPDPLLQKAMRWSKRLNERIAALTPADKPPFPYVREALAYAQGKADISVISSSNMAAIREEWGAHDLLGFLSVMTSQEIGTKDECVGRMLEKGYRPENVLMIGDAWPDVRAAHSNGVWYYPILTRREGESWEAFRKTYFDRFLQGSFGECQQELMDQFRQNFTQQGE